jgi:hypothetical protein
MPRHRERMLTVQSLVDWLRRFAVSATELGYANGCHVQLRVQSDGLLIVASSQASSQAAQVVPWPDVLAHRGVVSAAIEAAIRDIEGKRICYPQ